MSVQERIQACQSAMEALARSTTADHADATLSAFLTQWAAKQRGTPVFVADSSDFHGQFGDDRHGAYDMEDRMNEFAAWERDRVIDDVLAALAQGETPGAAGRVLVALDALGARRLGPYDQRAVAGALWQLSKLLESAAASGVVGGQIK